jgi:hypothetical protein
MGQCASGLGLTSNKCEKFKQAINILLKEKEKEKELKIISKKQIYFILKTLYAKSLNCEETITVEIINTVIKELNCMIIFITTEINTLINNNKYNELNKFIPALELLTDLLTNFNATSENNSYNKIQDLVDKNNKIQDLVFSDIDVEIQNNPEIQRILNEADAEVAANFNEQMPKPPDELDPPPQTGGNTNQHKEDIKHLRKLLTNKKLTEKQKEQYLKKIESIKVKIEKQNKTDKINKCKEHIKNLQKTLKDKNITESQKQQCHHKISNYKLKMEELK